MKLWPSWNGMSAIAVLFCGQLHGIRPAASGLVLSPQTALPPKASQIECAPTRVCKPRLAALSVGSPLAVEPAFLMEFSEIVRVARREREVSPPGVPGKNARPPLEVVISHACKVQRLYTTGKLISNHRPSTQRSKPT